MEDSIRHYKNIIKLINEAYPDSPFHKKVKKRAERIVSELEKKKSKSKRIAIMFWAFERLGEKGR